MEPGQPAARARGANPPGVFRSGFVRSDRKTWASNGASVPIDVSRSKPLRLVKYRLYRRSKYPRMQSKLDQLLMSRSPVYITLAYTTIWRDGSGKELNKVITWLGLTPPYISSEPRTNLRSFKV